MIVRKYGRRSRDYSGADSFPDVGSDSPSQECPQDVYNFTFSSQDSARCHWSDPYSCSSSQESKKLTILPPRNGGDYGDYDGGFRKSKKLKVIDVDSEPYGSSSSQESKEFGILANGGFKKPNTFKKPSNFKKVDFDPYEYNSSQEQEESIWPPKRVRENLSIFEFSEDVDVWKPNQAKVVGSRSHGVNSSQELVELGISQPRKLDSWEFDGVSRKSKKDRKENGVIQNKKLNVIDVDSEPCGSSSSQESKEFGILAISDAGFKKPGNFKKVDYDPYKYNSSQEQEEFSILPPKRGRENHSVFEFSEDADVWKPNQSKNFGSHSHGLNSSQELVELGISQPRKLDSWDFDGVSRISKKKDRKENGVIQKKNKNTKKMKEPESSYAMITTTLMETQEFGEMTEHVDEVNFSLDGLKKGAHVRIRRASLLSLLSICGTAQQRRLLRVHGMAKAIIDAVLGLSFDDSPSNLAAAALFYILTSDGQDEYRLDSPSCIRFLIKSLQPLTSGVASEKAPTIGSKLLGICKSAGFSQDSGKGKDSSSTAITLKVQDILVNCKEMKPKYDSDNRMEEPEMNPKWISLLIMEKACLSTFSIEDTFGTARKTGGNFKEKLREFGGLDAVFEVARKCHSTMEEWLEKSPTFALDLKDGLGFESLVVILKCLKIMENATFLSKDNQSHLLRMKGKFDGERAPRAFTKLILSVIKILSGVSLLRQDEKMGGTSNGSSNSGGCCSMECTASQKSIDASQCSQTGSYKSSLESSQVYADPLLLKMRVESSTAGSCSGTSGNPNSVIHISSDDSGLEFVGKRQLGSSNIGSMEYSQDPFAFDEVDFEPPKWDLRSGRVHKSPPQESRATVSESRDGNHSVTGLSQSINVENRHPQEPSCSSNLDDEKSSLLADCLLTSVKVLMNLANDNPEGCRQIAACGGLEVTSSLIAGHFPSFSSSLLSKQSNTQLTDQELDFLVAILGLLVNLVEKDGRNRSRLAAASVSVPSLECLGLEDERDVISLLCSIFLANQGDAEGTGEGKCLSLEDEDTILQGEKEAEKMIVEAYAALLLAFLSTESKSIRNAIAECLPKRNLSILVPVLERFVEFHMTLNVISPETHKAVLEVIESCRIP
ncbi:hypothetical protein ACJIZ3_013171 [Penstemon smallii]|uniref:Wings apart-like protein C-terminal domain-containing protein n=1 Tax=Penstemon smallii TaxID=265156 RepID=A0ABD3UP39_9LAMI